MNRKNLMDPNKKDTEEKCWFIIDNEDNGTYEIFKIFEGESVLEDSKRIKILDKDKNVISSYNGTLNYKNLTSREARVKAAHLRSVAEVMESLVPNKSVDQRSVYVLTVMSDTAKICTSPELKRFQYLVQWKVLEGTGNVMMGVHQLSSSVYKKNAKSFENIEYFQNRISLESSLVMEDKDSFYCFTRENLPKIKLIEQLYENELNSYPYDSVRRSPLIKQSVDHWIGNGKYEEIRNLADEVINGSMEVLTGVVKGMRTLAFIANGQVPKCFIVNVKNSLFVFVANTEEEVIKRFMLNIK